MPTETEYVLFAANAYSASRAVVYEDNDHLTDFGTSLAVGRLEAAIGRALAAGSSASRGEGDGR